MRTRNGVSMIRRRNEAGGYNYFISLLNDKAIDGTVTLATDAKAVEIFDPMTGKTALPHHHKIPPEALDVRLQLMPGQSLLLKTFPTRSTWKNGLITKPPMPPWPSIRAGS